MLSLKDKVFSTNRKAADDLNEETQQEMFPVSTADLQTEVRVSYFEFNTSCDRKEINRKRSIFRTAFQLNTNTTKHVLMYLIVGIN